jgi:hypothetical protein
LSGEDALAQVGQLASVEERFGDDGPAVDARLLQGLGTNLAMDTTTQGRQVLSVAAIGDDHATALRALVNSTVRSDPNRGLFELKHTVQGHLTAASSVRNDLDGSNDNQAPVFIQQAVEAVMAALFYDTRSAEFATDGDGQPTTHGALVAAVGYDDRVARLNAFVRDYWLLAMGASWASISWMVSGA